MKRVLIIAACCVSVAAVAAADPQSTPRSKPQVVRKPLDYRPGDRTNRTLRRGRQLRHSRARYRPRRQRKVKLGTHTGARRKAGAKGALSGMGHGLVAQRKPHKPARRKRATVKHKAAKRSPSRVRVDPGAATQLEALRKFVLSAPPERLAGDQRAQLRGAKMPELLKAARSGTLTSEDVATFAQSVHPSLLKVFEHKAGLPAGFFLTHTRAVQFPGGNPFMGNKAPPPAEARQLRQQIQQRLNQVVALHRKRGGQHLPHALQLLTSASHVNAPRSRGMSVAVKEVVQSIPLMELHRRHAYITSLSAKAILSQMPSRAALKRRPGLVNYDHLLKALGKVHDNKLLIEIYAENVPAKGKVGRYLPVTALGEGSYCVDDIARTTVALFQSARRGGRAELLDKARAGLRFVKMMQAKDGEFYNFAVLKQGKLRVNKDGVTSKKGIDFWAARAVWALGEGYATLRPSDPKAAASLARVIQRTLPRLEQPLKRYGKYHTVKGARLPAWLINDAADQTSVMLKGLLAYHRALPRGKNRQRVASIITRYAEGIAAAQVKATGARDRGRFYHSMKDPAAKHIWGARQVEVLAQAGKQLGRKEWIQAAALCADSYWGKHNPATLVQPGEEQISYGVESVVSGYARLHAATGNKAYAKATFNWAAWLFGKNKARAVMYDPISGRGYDGIATFQHKGRARHSVNGNSGAESTVEAILALQSASRVPGVNDRLRHFLERQLPR